MNNAQASSGKLSWTTRVAYGLGDTAQNVVWGAMSILTFSILTMLVLMLALLD
mgnify:CR=1 FL=1